MARLFNAYVMVDWSAAAKASTGPDSIWIGVLKRDVRFRLAFESFNPPTRSAAEKQLALVLDDLSKRSERALLGFDFPLGYPRGTAKALQLKSPDWVGMWAFLASNVVDKADNTNNRFAVASKMNRLMTDEARPFWGSPPKDVQRWLTSTKPPTHGDDLPPPLRHGEAAVHGAGQARPKTVWQIFGNGTVGSQAIVGIPAAARVKTARGDAVKVWPFETGWKPLTPVDLEGVEVVACEIYPSNVKTTPVPGEVKDLTQVRTCCEHFARLDEAGKLAAVFGPPKGVDEAMVAEVEGEEGWILGG